jgi:hypothetical protein
VRACAAPLAGACALALAPFGPAEALLVDAPDTKVSESAPPHNPGWDHVGRRATLSGIHLRGGWVLTARHVGGGDLVLGGASHTLVPDTWQQLQNPDDSGTWADLVLFRVDPPPDLPELPLRETPLTPGTGVVLVGYGLGRGDTLEWNGVHGYRWGGSGAKRWGTNRVRQVALDVPMPHLRTRCFDMSFDRQGSRFEAQAALGDSGGAVLARRGGRWELAGVLVDITTFPGQPPASGLFGNTTSAADISYYRDQILAVMAGHVPRPPGGGGPPPGAATKLP